MAGTWLETASQRITVGSFAQTFQRKHLLRDPNFTEEIAFERK